MAIDDLKYEFGATFTYQQAFMQIKDFVCSGLLKTGSTFESKQVTANETLSPATKNFITREWLAKIDPRLPKHVNETRGHLFTAERPSLACNQKILCDQVPTMLQELDSKPDSLSQGNVNIGYVPAYNRGQMPRGGRYINMGRGMNRGARPQLPTRQSGCFRCLEATPRRYDAAKTHLVRDCPYPPQRQLQQRRNPPNFRVVMFPENQPVQQPQLAAVAMGQADIYGQDAGYYYDNTQYYGQEPGQQEATLEELPPQDL